MLNTSMMLADQLGSLNLPVVSVDRRINERTGRTEGMLVTFANRMTLSIQWHSGAYSNVGRGCWEPGEAPTFECAAWFPEEFDTPWIVDGKDWGKRRKWFRNDPEDYDDVLPYVTIPEVIAFAHKVAAVVLDVANFGKAIALVAAR